HRRVADDAWPDAGRDGRRAGMDRIPVSLEVVDGADSHFFDGGDVHDRRGLSAPAGPARTARAAVLGVRPARPRQFTSVALGNGAVRGRCCIGEHASPFSLDWAPVRHRNVANSPSNTTSGSHRGRAHPRLDDHAVRPRVAEGVRAQLWAQCAVRLSVSYYRVHPRIPIRGKEPLMAYRREHACTDALDEGRCESQPAPASGLRRNLAGWLDWIR